MSYNSEQWYFGYTDGRRSLLRENAEEQLSRLRRLGILDLPRHGRVLDLGCGDGNLITTLRNQGFLHVTGLEPDGRLVERSRERAAIVVGRGPDLPFGNEEFDVVLCMASIHHLKSADEMWRLQDEVWRILRPGGRFLYVEPAQTLLRRVLTPLLLSPLSGLTQFSRQKRAMVLAEWPELNAWLRLETIYPANLANKPFRIHINDVVGLKRFVHAEKTGGDDAG